jgi:minimal PKS acyl carrier protein
MSRTQVTIDDLRRVIHEGAGVDEGTDIGPDALDVEFQELGYDSLALLETIGRLSREYDLRVSDEEALAEATTPRRLLQLVNGG